MHEVTLLRFYKDESTDEIKYQTFFNMADPNEIANLNLVIDMVKSQIVNEYFDIEENDIVEEDVKKIRRLLDE